jgi:RimJ/RimL family protein N-acetyltransferase
MARPVGIVPPDPPLTDGVVVLRAARESDLPGLLEDGSDAETRRWVNVPDPYDEREAADELRRFMFWWDDPSAPLALVIADAASDDYLGAVVLFADRPHGIVELGYAVRPSTRGRGAGTRGLRLAVEWAFTAPGQAARGAHRPGERRLAAGVGQGGVHPRGRGARVTRDQRPALRHGVLVLARG